MTESHGRGDLVSIVIPAHDERANLESLLDELRAVLDRLGPAEVLVVDDGSRDGTAELLLLASRRDPRVCPVLLETRVGQSGALAAGLSRARGDVIVTMDADLQNDPADIPRLLESLRGADVVSGVRVRRNDGRRRRAASRVANAVRRAVLRDGITDIGCSLKAYRRACLEGLPSFEGAHRFLAAMCVLRGARLREVEVRHRARRHGHSHYGIARRAWGGAIDLAGMLWLRGRLLRYRIREVD